MTEKKGNEYSNLPDLIDDLKPHDHLCLIYESREEWLATVVPFISSGLKKGEKCIYVVDANTASQIKEILKEAGLAVDDYESKGQLSILHERDTYTREGYFDPDLMIALLIGETKIALKEGYPALRVTGEMSWALRDYSGVDKVLEYEAKLNRDLFPDYPCVAICQYDRWKFDPEIIKGVVLTHPLLIRGGHIYHNFYYVEPDEYLNHKKSEREVQHWLNNLERERKAQESLRESEARFRVAQEISPDGFSILRPVRNEKAEIIDFTWVYENQAIANINGTDPQEVIGKRLLDLFPDHSGTAIFEAYIDVANSGKPQIIEDVYVGEIVSKPTWLRLVVISMGGDIATLAQDISERKQAEETLLQEKLEKELIINNLTEQVTFLDLEMNIVWANSEVIKRQNLSSKDYLGEKCYKAYHQIAEPCPDCPIIDVFKTGIPSGGIYRSPDGRYWQMAGKPVFDKDGVMIGVLDTALDISDLKLAEQALIDSEEKFKAIANHTVNWESWFGPDGKYLWVNPAVEKFTGYSPSEILATPDFISTIIAEEDRAIFRVRMSEAIGGSQGENFEFRYLHKDGTKRWLSASWQPIFDVKGNFLGARSSGQDITERKQAEEDLLITQLTVDNSPLSVFWISPEGKFIYVNETVTKKLGYSPDELLSMHVWDVDPNYPQEKRKEQWNVHRQEKQRSVESEHRRRDGTTYPVRINISHLTFEGKEMEVAAAEDITEQKQAERLLQNQSDLMQSYLDTTDTIMVSLDLSGDITMLNRYGLKLLEYDEEQVIGKNWFEFALPQPEGMEKVYPVFQQIMNDDLKPVSYYENEVLTASGKRYTIAWRNNHLLDEDGKIIGTLSSGIDITEKKEAEAEILKLNKDLERRIAERTVELKAVNKELESFAYSISHDFRAPLRALDGFSASLLTKYDEHLDNEGRHYLDRIRNAAIYMSNLVDDLLDLSRITRKEFKKQQVDLSKIASEVITLLQETEPQHKARFKITPGLHVSGDAALLQSALQNLLENAWKFSSKETQAEIELGRTTVKGEEVFFLRDNGVGFNMAYAKNLFGAFQRLHKVGEFPGTGIGLATVQRIINRHGGRIWAESEVGKGATFYFTLRPSAPGEPTKVNSKA